MEKIIFMMEHFSHQLVEGDGIFVQMLKEKGIAVYSENEVTEVFKISKWRKVKMGHILWVEPVFKEMIWGGNQLKEKYGYAIPSDQTGECWAPSAHPNGDNKIKEGEFKGQTLSKSF